MKIFEDIWYWSIKLIVDFNFTSTAVYFILSQKMEFCKVFHLIECSTKEIDYLNNIGIKSRLSNIISIEYQV